MGVGYLTGQGGGGASVKSVQSGIISDAAQTTFSVAISAVNINNSIIILEYENTGGASQLIIYNTLLRAAFVTGSQISITRGSISGINLQGQIIKWTVIEFNNVKTLQRGTQNTISNSQDVTISNVDISKSVIFCSASGSSTASGSITRTESFGYFVDGSNIKVYPSTSSYNIFVNWQVIEFK